MKAVKACLLRAPAPIESNPLDYTETDRPVPCSGEVLVRVKACGICRTDLHVVEGELTARKSLVIPGHQAVGVIEENSPGAQRFTPGVRVGVPWLHRTCGTCRYCLAGRENLCERSLFTGWTANGGYAEFLVAPEDFVYELPSGFGDLDAAPLLCAGIIGFRALRLSGIQAGGNLGLYGFGAAAHVAIQVARHWGVTVYAMTRDERHRKLALELGAAWAGPAAAEPPVRMDASIIFAPAGELVPAALKVLDKGGTLVLGGIHMSTIPPLEYQLLYHERVIRSVANNTRRDGEEFLRIAAGIPVRTQIRLFPLAEANQALNALKHDAISGAGVLKIM